MTLPTSVLLILRMNMKSRWLSILLVRTLLFVGTLGLVLFMPWWVSYSVLLLLVGLCGYYEYCLMGFLLDGIWMNHEFALTQFPLGSLLLLVVVARIMLWPHLRFAHD